MRFVVLFSACSLLIGCNNRQVPPFPHIDWCQGVREGDTRFAECASAYESDAREYEIPQEKPFDENFFMFSRPHATAVLKWQEDVKIWAAKYCK